MKLSLVQWIAILGVVFLLLIAAHWAMSDAPKPTISTPIFSPITPITNATNLSGTNPQSVASQEQGRKDLGNSIPVYYSPTDPTISWLS